VRAALGGVRDEADIRGHRRTYVGALPGRLIQGMRQAGTKNPVFLLDEVDKLGVSLQGDPSSALLEVLDPAQNSTFTDHYLGVPFDLTEVLFIATGNFLHQISPPLLDRMELVEFAGYTEREKAEIARRYLLSRQLGQAGLGDHMADSAFTDDALSTIITSFTRESGVRQLERQIGAVARKLARKLASDEEVPKRIDAELVRSLLGRPRVRPEQANAEDEVGVATGLYYSPSGGDIMFVEAAIRSRRDASPVPGAAAVSMGGDVSLILTGQLGEIMRESARAALTFVTTHAAGLHIPTERLGSFEAHVHVPAGAVPKDGPSAGVAIATALASSFSGRAVRRDVAMTGEITLRGHVLPIGGVKEKVLGAHRAGIREVVLPKANEPDLDDVPDDVRRELEFHFVPTLHEVLAVALAPEAAFASSSNGIDGRPGESAQGAL
jgi:ATP-dependent Lon protease